MSEKTDDFHGLEVLKLSALNEENPSEVHYVFNCLTYDYEFEQTLKIYFGVEKVKRFSDIEGFLNKKQRMELMKKRSVSKQDFNMQRKPLKNMCRTAMIC